MNSTTRADDHVEALESRRLLSLTTAGPIVEVARARPQVATAHESFVEVAVADDGSFVVAADIMYRPGFEELETRLEVTRYAASGAPIYGPVIVVEPGPIGGIFGVSTDADGDTVVRLQRQRDRRRALHPSKVLQPHSKDGVVSPPVKLQGFGQIYSVSMDAGGGFFVAGFAPFVNTGSNTVLIQAFDADGNPRAAAFPALNAGTSKSPIDISAFPDGSGAMFAYIQGATPTLTVGRVNATARVGKARYVAEPGVPALVRFATPSVATHADRSFVVAFDREQEPTRFEIPNEAPYAIRFDVAGNPLSPEIDLAAGLPGGIGLEKGIEDVDIDSLPDGGFVATFAQHIGGVELDALYARRFDANGVLDPAGSLVVAKGARRPAIGADARGRVVVAWDAVPGSSMRMQQLTTAIAFNGNGEVFVSGTEGADHIIIERVRDKLFVNVNGIVRGFFAADVRFLSINGFGGDDDIINGSVLPSTIYGGDGADTLWGGIGPDRLRGFGGNDVLRDGDGEDVLFGDNGDDVVLGGDDQDLLLGDAGEDTLLGSSGNDTLRGHRGSDRLFGEAGNDTLEGGDADDYLEGGAGHDQLDGGAGRDALFGLAGNDRFFTDDGAADTVRGGLGDDEADVDGLDDVLAVESLS